MPALRRESRSTSCAICRQPVAAGERLCAPCRSALKRARDTTVSEAILPLRRQRKRPAAPKATEASAAPANAPPSPRWVRGAWAIAVGGLLVAGGAWIVHTRGIAGTIAPRYAIAAPESGAETIKAAATTADPGAGPAAPAEREASPVERTGTRSLDARSLPSTITVPRAAPHVEPAPLPVAAPAVVPSVAEAPSPAPVVVAQASAPRPASPDRWQQLADAIARCPAGDVITRTVCQETLRLEYCEGQWGRVAACPARPERDYGN